jgi:hypothetical protein
MAWGCVKCLDLKGLAGGQSHFDDLLKYIFAYSQIFIGNVPAVI